MVLLFLIITNSLCVSSKKMIEIKQYNLDKNDNCEYLPIKVENHELNKCSTDTLLHDTFGYSIEFENCDGFYTKLIRYDNNKCLLNSEVDDIMIKSFDILKVNSKCYSFSCVEVENKSLKIFLNNVLPSFVTLLITLSLFYIFYLKLYKNVNNDIEKQ